MAFFSDFPAETKVVFNDGQVLVAKSKGEALILRLDEKDDSTA